LLTNQSHELLTSLVVGGLWLNTAHIIVRLCGRIFPQHPFTAYRRPLFTLFTLAALGWFGSLCGVAAVSLKGDLLCGCAFSLFSGWFFHLDPDWGRLPELLTLVRESMGQLVPGAEQTPIVLTDAQLKLAGTNHVGAEWADFMARLNLDLRLAQLVPK
jgi:hypothetical protein